MSRGGEEVGCFEFRTEATKSFIVELFSIVTNYGIGDADLQRGSSK